MTQKRIHRRRDVSPEELAREKAIREKFQSERPTLEDLQRTGDYTEPVTQRELLQAEQQRSLCRRSGADWMPVAPGSRVGIALQTLNELPLNGLRIAAEGNACDWYLWGGEEWSDAADFFQPLCVEHVAETCPLAIPFLGLPTGWRFLTDGNFIDVWYDPQRIGGRPDAEPGTMG